MAQAKKDIKKVTKTVEVDEETFTLELSREEAEALQSLLSRTNSVNQGHTYHVWEALDGLGINGTAWKIIDTDRNKPVPTLRLEESDW